MNACRWSAVVVTLLSFVALIPGPAVAQAEAPAKPAAEAKPLEPLAHLVGGQWRGELKLLVDPGVHRFLREAGVVHDGRPQRLARRVGDDLMRLPRACELHQPDDQEEQERNDQGELDQRLAGTVPGTPTGCETNAHGSASSRMPQATAAPIAIAGP